MLYVNLMIDNADYQIRDDIIHCVKNGSIFDLAERLEFKQGVKMFLVNEYGDEYAEVNKDISIFWNCLDIVTLKDQDDQMGYDIDIETGDVFPYKMQLDKTEKTWLF